jgi:hypothetical protein
MAKVWPVYEGREPTRGGPWAEIPLLEAVELLGLRKRDFVSPLEKTPRFGDPSRDLWYLGYQQVVVEVGEKEAKRANWKPGFYKLKIAPKEALRRIVTRAVVSELGKENVKRVEIEPGIDAVGDRALRVTVVINPESVKKIGRPFVEAVVRVQQLGDEPTVVVEFATEAELARNARSQS